MALLAVLFIALLIIGVVLHRSRAGSLVHRWAEANGYTLVNAEYRYLRKGPFVFRSGDQNAVYRIAVRDGSGHTREGYARCGGFWSGMWFSDRVTVEWDA